jgi:hypothetical protein
MIAPLLLALVLASPAPSPAPAAPPANATPVATGTPSLVPPFETPPPFASPLPAGTPTPSGSPAPGASPLATPTGIGLPPLHYHVVPKPSPSLAPGAPVITDIFLNDETIGNLIAMRVLTNDVVTKVTVKAGGKTGALTEVAPGRFEAKSSVPRIGIMSVKVAITVTAFTVDGRSTSTVVTVKKK